MLKWYIIALFVVCFVFSSCGSTGSHTELDEVQEIEISAISKDSMSTSSTGFEETTPVPTVNYIKRAIEGPANVELLYSVLDSISTYEGPLWITGAVFTEDTFSLGGTSRRDIEPVLYEAVDGSNSGRAKEYIETLQCAAYKFSENYFFPVNTEEWQNRAWVQTEQWTLCAIGGYNELKLSIDGVDYYYFVDIDGEDGGIRIYDVFASWYEDAGGEAFFVKSD